MGVETKPENPPAFPRAGFWTQHDTSVDADTMPQEGMPLRDYFAAKAMQALLSNTDTLTALVKQTPDGRRIEAIAVASYQVAEAMLVKRSK